MKNTNFLITTPKLQKEINQIEKNIEQEKFTHPIEDYQFCDIQLPDNCQLPPDIQSLITTQMNNILSNIHTIIQSMNQSQTHLIEENYKTEQNRLMQLVEQYSQELSDTKSELHRLQQSISIYKSEINKLMQLIYARNCLIQKLSEDNEALQKRQHVYTTPISSKILF
ncbi:3'-5' exonuclease [Wohlfahrtiimonas larvae]|uniref:Uncharacterized protein n=1 Tax=Wohlfahrtiimonas larvae TaxID=1157986 RepID=A0ABP9N3E0_9GAMM|nr:3'-5' exonuclease [Wohlfahrtiimonas larvae]